MGRPCRCCKGPKCCCSPWVIYYDDNLNVDRDCVLESSVQNVQWNLGNLQNGNIGGAFILPPSANCSTPKPIYPNDYFLPGDVGRGEPYTKGHDKYKTDIRFSAYKIININSPSFVRAELIGDVERDLGDKDVHRLTLIKMQENSGLKAETNLIKVPPSKYTQSDWPNGYRYQTHISGCEHGFCGKGSLLKNSTDDHGLEGYGSSMRYREELFNNAATHEWIDGSSIGALSPYSFLKQGGGYGIDSEDARLFLNGVDPADVLTQYALPYPIYGGWPSRVDSLNTGALTIESALCSSYCSNTTQHNTLTDCYRTIFCKGRYTATDTWNQINQNITKAINGEPAEWNTTRGFHLSLRSDRCSEPCASTRKSVTLDSVPLYYETYTREQIQTVINSGLFTRDGKYPLVLEPGCYALHYEFVTPDTVDIVDDWSGNVIKAGGRSSYAIGAFSVDFQSVYPPYDPTLDTCSETNFVIRPNSVGYPNNYDEILHKDVACDSAQVVDGANVYRYYYVDTIASPRCCPLVGSTNGCSSSYHMNFTVPDYTLPDFPIPYYIYYGPGFVDLNNRFRVPAGYVGPLIPNYTSGPSYPHIPGLLMEFYVEDADKPTIFCAGETKYNRDLFPEWVLLDGVFVSMPRCRMPWQS